MASFWFLSPSSSCCICNGSLSHKLSPVRTGCVDRIPVPALCVFQEGLLNKPKLLCLGLGISVVTVRCPVPPG